MTLDLAPDELLTTTRTVRKRLDLDRPVERSLVETCLEVAFRAGTKEAVAVYRGVAGEEAGGGPSVQGLPGVRAGDVP